jgi:hypothetical protein
VIHATWRCPRGRYAQVATGVLALASIVVAWACGFAAAAA